MVGPPPLPRLDAAARLAEEAAKLDVEDILALCFSFNRDARRLSAYLDALRKKGTGKSQAAACLVCFDLGRQAHTRYQDEFLTLVPVIRDYCARPRTASGQRPIDVLIDGDEYLADLLADLESRFETIDPRTEDSVFEEPTLDDIEPAEIQLFDDDDFYDVDLGDVLDESHQHLYEQWNDALDRFLGVGVMTPGDGDFGFVAASKAGLARVERLRDDADSVSRDVPAARSMRPLAELFLASHMRAKNLFGRPTKGRARALRDGLEHFTALPYPPSDMVSWLVAPTAAPFAWEKTAEVLLDYVAFLYTADADDLGDLEPRSLADAYIYSERPQPAPRRLEIKKQKRRR